MHLQDIFFVPIPPNELSPLIIWCLSSRKTKARFVITIHTGLKGMTLRLLGFIQYNDRYNENTDTEGSECYCLLNSRKLKSRIKTSSYRFLSVNAWATFPSSLRCYWVGIALGAPKGFKVFAFSFGFE